VIVGIAVAGRTPPTDSSYITKEHAAYLTYRHQAGECGELLMVRETFPFQGTFAATENGMPMIYRPFAIRLPAGLGEFVTFGHRRGINKTRDELRSTTVSYKDQKGQWQTRRELRW
jgi:hypothetical protein